MIDIKVKKPQGGYIVFMNRFARLAHRFTLAKLIIVTLIFGGTAAAQPLILTDQWGLFDSDAGHAAPQQSVAAPAHSSPDLIPAHLRRQTVGYATREPAGTIIIDTSGTHLYYVLGGGRAIRYGIGVGREGFTWSGTRVIERKAEWPDWTPPPEMILRQPYLPRFMAGGPGNPLGARAMYLSGTLYRIHGTSEPSSIGKHVSSGCIRMLNEDVIDLYGRATIGTKVVVLPDIYHRPVIGNAGDEIAEVPYYGPSQSYRAVRRQRF